jgi:hypothetical protein
MNYYDSLLDTSPMLIAMNLIKQGAISVNLIWTKNTDGSKTRKGPVSPFFCWINLGNPDCQVSFLDELPLDVSALQKRKRADQALPRNRDEQQIAHTVYRTSQFS